MINTIAGNTVKIKFNKNPLNFYESTPSKNTSSENRRRSIFNSLQTPHYITRTLKSGENHKRCYSTDYKLKRRRGKPSDTSETRKLLTRGLNMDRDGGISHTAHKRCYIRNLNSYCVNYSINRDLFDMRESQGKEKDPKKFKLYSDLVIKDMQSKISQLEQENQFLKQKVQIYEQRETQYEKQLGMYRKIAPSLQNSRDGRSPERVKTVEQRIRSSLSCHKLSKANMTNKSSNRSGQGKPKITLRNDMKPSRVTIYDMKHTEAAEESSRKMFSGLSTLNSNQLAKIEKFAKSIMKVQTVFEVIHETLQEISNFFDTKAADFYILDQAFDRSIERTPKNSEYFSYASIDRQVYQSIGLSGGKPNDPLITNINSLSNGVVTQNKMIYPILDSNGAIQGCYQISLSEKTAHLRESRTDFATLKVLVMISHCAILNIQSMNESAMCKNDLVNLMKFSSEICAARNLKIFSYKIHEILPKFLGFESASLLLVNNKSSEEEDGQEYELYHIPYNPEDTSSILTGSVLRFPCTMGITGRVYTSQTPYFTNYIVSGKSPDPVAENPTREDSSDVQDSYLYEGDIDNVSNIKDLSNLLIMPLLKPSFESKKPCTPEVIGVIQLHNKRNGGKAHQFATNKEASTPFAYPQKASGLAPTSSLSKAEVDVCDLEKLESIGPLLAMCLINIFDIGKSVNIAAGVKEGIAKIENLAKDEVFGEI
ncbi:unnamed protein product [Moneuplotes crassus]|uniref:GAF domain-containing protein n=1 Tax=Euplotes crassus TaxID=5936 RepID=A0AAD2D5U4_EUPCR|nr:unnamed protein product [Moneuplotes crassus]